MHKYFRRPCNFSLAVSVGLSTGGTTWQPAKPQCLETESRCRQFEAAFLLRGNIYLTSSELFHADGKLQRGVVHTRLIRDAQGQRKVCLCWPSLLLWYDHCSLHIAPSSKCPVNSVRQIVSGKCRTVAPNVPMGRISAEHIYTAQCISGASFGSNYLSCICVFYALVLNCHA